MEIKRILVIGGSGYIGREIVTKLVEEKYSVSILSRNPEENKSIHVIKGSVLDKQFLINNVKGFDVVVYLAAIVRSLNKSKYKENLTGIQNTIEAMQKNDIKRLIYFSTQNVHIGKTGPYGSSKKLSEKKVLSSSLNYIIIRPNYVYGIDRQNDFYRISKIIKKIRICPVLGSGNNKFQPINKEDVAKITLNILRHFRSRKIIDISGSKTLTINDIVDYIAEYTRIKFIRIHIPISLLKLFKYFLPFDIDGYEADRLAISKNDSYKALSDIKEDIGKITGLP